MRLKKGTGIRGFMILFFMLAFCGCGEKDGIREIRESEAVLDTWEPIRVLEHAWKGYDKVQEAEQPWYPEDFYDGFGEAAEEGWIRGESLYARAGDQFYALSVLYEEGESRAGLFQLTCVDTVSMEETKQRFEISDLILPAKETEGEGGSSAVTDQLVSMDALGDSICLFLARYDETWKLLHYYCVEIGTDQRPAKNTDFAQQLFGENRREPVNLPKGYMSTEGDICFISEQEKRLELFSGNGEVKARMELKDIPGNIRVSLIGRAQEGTPVFGADDWQGHVCFFTPETVIYSGEYESVLHYLGDDGELLFWQDSALVRWNVETGEAKELCSLKGLQSYFCKGIFKNAKGQIVLAYDEGNDLCFYRYTVGADSPGSTLRIAAFFTDPYIEECAADYERTHPGIRVEFVEFDNPFQNDMALNRLAEECKAGMGPDLIRFTQKEQMESLEGAGCLAPLDGSLSAETMNGLFDSLPELGKIGGRTYGLCYQASLLCFMTSKEKRGQSARSLQEMMERFEENRNPETGSERFLADNYPVDSQQLLYELCLLNLEDTPFVDFENKSCSFCTQEFCDLLRFCQNFADGREAQYLSYEELVSQMREGNAMYCRFSGGLSGYSRYRADLGKDFVTVGKPSETEQGYIISSNDFISMNVFSDQEDLAADFLEYLFSERCQIRYGRGEWVRKDVIENRIREHVTKTDYLTGKEVTECVFVISDREVMPLAVDENGDSFVREYISLMDHASPYIAHEKVREIISGEADAVFAGAKTAEEAARIIQNRVELFLKE